MGKDERNPRPLLAVVGSIAAIRVSATETITCAGPSVLQQTLLALLLSLVFRLRRVGKPERQYKFFLCDQVREKLTSDDHMDIFRKAVLNVRLYLCFLVIVILAMD